MSPCYVKIEPPGRLKSSFLCDFSRKIRKKSNIFSSFLQLFEQKLFVLIRTILKKSHKMPIKNEKIGQNFRENTKIRQKSNKKSARPAWKNENFEKIFLREKNFPWKFQYEGFFPYPIGPVMLLVLVWAWLARLTGLRTWAGTNSVGSRGNSDK